MGAAPAALAVLPHGRMLLAVVARGPIALGIFSFAEARYRWSGPG
jgi:hypothetical protein